MIYYNDSVYNDIVTISFPKAHIRDPSGQIHTVRNLRLILNEMNHQPQAPMLMRKMLQESVNRCQTPPVNGNRGNVITVGSYDLQIGCKFIS